MAGGDGTGGNFRNLQPSEIEGIWVFTSLFNTVTGQDDGSGFRGTRVRASGTEDQQTFLMAQT